MQIVPAQTDKQPKQPHTCSCAAISCTSRCIWSASRSSASRSAARFDTSAVSWETCGEKGRGTLTARRVQTLLCA